jgi:RNA polymerase sigma factor for flagellar operon FliA
MTTCLDGCNAAKVWREYKRSGGLALRNKLMEAYMPIVRYNAERIGAKLPQEVDNEDLMSAGVFGLIDAIEAFDLKRGIKFETYCAPRIRGAILDELRSLDWVPRLVRSRSTKLGRVQAELQYLLGREPTESEIAEWLEITPEEYEKLRKAASAVTQVSLSRKHGETDSNREVCEIDVLEDKRGRDPVRELQRKDLRDLLTRGFSRAERLIVVLYYYEEMTMKEIGQILDLSESRVSQMHSAILERLKEQFRKRQKELTN